MPVRHHSEENYSLDEVGLLWFLVVHVKNLWTRDTLTGQCNPRQEQQRRYLVALSPKKRPGYWVNVFDEDMVALSEYRA